MDNPQTNQRAWDSIIEYATAHEAVETAQRGNRNKLRVDLRQEELIFESESGNERRVTREEFDAVWNQFQSKGYVTREEVGEETSAWVGAALFGALNDVFDLEIDQSTSSIALRTK